MQTQDLCASVHPSQSHDCELPPIAETLHTICLRRVVCLFGTSCETLIGGSNQLLLWVAVRYDGADHRCGCWQPPPGVVPAGGRGGRARLLGASCFKRRCSSSLQRTVLKKRKISHHLHVARWLSQSRLDQWPTNGNRSSFLRWCANNGKVPR